MAGAVVPQVARSLEMSDKTLANWVAKARKGVALLNRQPSVPVERMRCRECAAAPGERPSEDGEGDSKKGGGVLREGVAVKYAWIEENRDEFEVTMMCQLLGVSRSGFHASTPDGMWNGTLKVECVNGARFRREPRRRGPSSRTSAATTRNDFIRVTSCPVSSSGSPRRGAIGQLTANRAVKEKTRCPPPAGRFVASDRPVRLSTTLAGSWRP